MSKYRVAIPFCVWQYIEVEADSPGEAEEFAFAKAGLTAFAGNGGTDKLVGVRYADQSVEACGEPIDQEPFQVQVDLIGQGSRVGANRDDGSTS